MENKIIFLAGLKKHKGSLLGIAFLMLLVSLALNTVLVVYFGGEKRLRQEQQRAGFGTLTAWVAAVPDTAALAQAIEAQEGVSKVTVQELVFSEYEAGGSESDSAGQLLVWRAGEERYRFFRDDLTAYQNPPEEFAAGSVYISPAMSGMMNLGIGDTVTFQIARGGGNAAFTVAGFYEDPFMGSAMIGMKGFLISEPDYQTVSGQVETAGIDALAKNGAMLHIFAEREEPGIAALLNQRLNERTPLTQYSEAVHSADTMAGFMLILRNAFSALLAAFAVILLGVTLVILGHTVSGIIRQDYVNLAIMKATGLTGAQLIRLQLLQYLAAAGGGALSGIPGAMLLSRAVNQITITSTGVLIPAELPLPASLGALGVIMLLLAVFTRLKLSKINQVTPIGAIRGETAARPDSPKRSVRIGSRLLVLQLAMRQLRAAKRRYVSAAVIAALLVFFASLAGRMNAWLGPDGKGMMDAFNPADLDIGIQVTGTLDPAEMEALVGTYSEITDRYLLAMPDVSVAGTNYTANVISEPQRFHISRGRTCLNPEEIVLTETAAADLGVTVGDTVTIRGDSGSGAYQVAGIYHCANQMGANIGMNREGYRTIGTAAPDLWCYHYFLADKTVTDELTAALEEAYGGDVHIHQNSWPGLAGIIAAMQALLVFMYGMIAVFVLVVTVMTGSRILAAEQKDLGIYKAIGYSGAMLRGMFSLRYGITAALGAMLGILIAAVLTDPLTAAVLRLAGISNFSSAPAVTQILLPGVTVTILFMIFSYLAAGRIKRMDMTALTAD